MKEKKKNWKPIIQWVGGGLFILSGIGNFSESPIASTMMFLAGVFILPITQELIDEKYNIPGPLKYIALFCWIGLTAFIGAQLQDGNVTEEKLSSNNGKSGIDKTITLSEQEKKALQRKESVSVKNHQEVKTTSYDQYIPNLSPIDVYLNMENVGYVTEKDLGTRFGNFWISKLKTGGVEYEVSVQSDNADNVQSIRATALNASTRGSSLEVKQFLKYVGSLLFLYRDNGQSKFNNWIDNHFGSGGKTRVGSVYIELIVPTQYAHTMYIRSEAVYKKLQ